MKLKALTSLAKMLPVILASSQLSAKEPQPDVETFQKQSKVLGISSQCVYAYMYTETEGFSKKSEKPEAGSNHAFFLNLDRKASGDLRISGYFLGAISSHGMNFTKSVLGEEHFAEDMRKIAAACDKIAENAKTGA